MTANRLAKNQASLDREAIADWLTGWIARELPMPLDEIDRDEHLESYGMSSLLVVTLSGELEDLVGRPIDPSAVYDRPTINQLADYLADAEQET
jgi:acyl carrier protein